MPRWPVLPDQLFKALGDMLIDVCGGHAPVRQEPITPDEWHELHSRWCTLVLMNQKQEPKEPCEDHGGLTRVNDSGEYCMLCGERMGDAPPIGPDGWRVIGGKP